MTKTSFGVYSLVLQDTPDIDKNLYLLQTETEPAEEGRIGNTIEFDTEENAVEYINKNGGSFIILKCLKGHNRD